MGKRERNKEGRKEGEERGEQGSKEWMGRGRTDGGRKRKRICREAEREREGRKEKIREGGGRGG